ncbi:MAG: type IX secretion system membrane protein PorP/SprF [Bacteroidia bacterium]
MKKAKLLLGLFCLIASTSILVAQDPQFSQFYANPIYLNPALAGSKLCPRLCFNYRNQWPNISGTFVTNSVSFDKMVDGIHGGVGLIATSDASGEGTIKTNTISAIYSYHQPLNRKVSLAAAMEVSYRQKSVDWSKLTFGDMINPINGFVRNTAENPNVSPRNNIDFSTGAVLFSERYFVGFAASHLTQPNEALFNDGSSTLPIKYTAHAGLKIPVGPNGNSDVIVSPNIIWQKQQDFQELNLGLYLQKGPIVVGLWYRNMDAFILLLGADLGTFRVGYSYDVTMSRLTNSTAGAHEISFSMGFACKKHKPHYRLGSCPSF